MTTYMTVYAMTACMIYRTAMTSQTVIYGKVCFLLHSPGHGVYQPPALLSTLTNNILKKYLLINQTKSINAPWLKIVFEKGVQESRAGHPTTLPRQRDHVFRPQSWWI